MRLTCSDSSSVKYLKSSSLRRLVIPNGQQVTFFFFLRRMHLDKHPSMNTAMLCSLIANGYTPPPQRTVHAHVQKCLGLTSHLRLAQMTLTRLRLASTSRFYHGLSRSRIGAQSTSTQLWIAPSHLMAFESASPAPNVSPSCGGKALDGLRPARFSRYNASSRIPCRHRSCRGP